MENDIVRFVSEGFDAAKGGNAPTIYRLVLPHFEKGQLPVRSHYPFGWIIYYALHQHPDSGIIERKKMLANYMKLNVTKPHKLHSMVLLEAMRLYKDSKNVAFNMRGKDAPRFSLIKFCELWNLENLCEGDWRQREYEGKKMSSTVEKLITLYMDEADDTKTLPSDSFIGVIERAVNQYPRSFTLMAQRASLHEMQGETEYAKTLLRKALHFAPRKFFLWSRLAALHSPETSPRIHVALLYKALVSPGQEQFKVGIRLSLAEAFIIKGLYHYALWELNRVRKTYESKEWHLPRKYTETMKKIPRETVPADPAALYRKLEPLAEKEINEFRAP